MSILIVGDTGTIGHFLYDKLKTSDNNKVVGISSKKVDLTSINEIKQFCKSHTAFKTIIFLVGLAHKKGKNKDYVEFEAINYQTLVNLLSVLKEQHKLPQKLIYTSTISVYGERYNISHYNESSVTHPSTPYAITKLKAENYLNTHFKNISWILRLAPVYSPTFTLNIDRKTKIKNTFYKVGSGSVQLSLCNIENIYTAIEGILNNIVQKNTYNISDKKEYTYKNLLDYQNASKIITIPKFLVQLAYLFGYICNNNFLKENCIKLLTNNIYPSTKIQRLMKINHNL